MPLTLTESENENDNDNDNNAKEATCTKAGMILLKRNIYPITERIDESLTIRSPVYTDTPLVLCRCDSNSDKTVTVT